jgi:hypothetical protein
MKTDKMTKGQNEVSTPVLGMLGKETIPFSSQAILLCYWQQCKNTSRDCGEGLATYSSKFRRHFS